MLPDSGGRGECVLRMGQIKSNSGAALLGATPLLYVGVI
jgi:hypothetical protein